MDIKTSGIKEEKKALNKELYILLQSAETHIASRNTRLANNVLEIFIKLYPKEHVSSPELLNELDKLDKWYIANRTELEKIVNGTRYLEKTDAEAKIFEIGVEYVEIKHQMCYGIFTKYKMMENETDDYPL
jgi:predicted HAD superfamily phosphohydrolase